MIGQHYYIDADGRRDGPLDLITVMRRIRLGKIKADSLLYIDDAAAGTQAKDIADIAVFFGQANMGGARRVSGPPSFSALVKHGWHFTIEHNVMTVFSGSFLLLAILLGSAFSQLFGMVVGKIAIVVLMLPLYYLYLVFVLRLHRGQTLGPDFMKRHLKPVLGSLIGAGMIMALMLVGGLLLLVVPGVLLMIGYCFVPMMILDKRYGVVEAMQGSRLLLRKNNWAYLTPVTALILMQLIGLVLILPALLTMPIFAAAISELYEKLSAS